MSKKQQGLTHSQTLGIIWLSAALLLIAAIVFFSSRHTTKPTHDDSITPPAEEILTAKEDSVYRSRRNDNRNNHIVNEKQPTSPRYTTTPPPPTKQPLMVDLNSADTLTLQLLHGIGPTFAHRIVRYRERLGGFVDTSQLLEVYGFTPELLSHISPHLRLDTTAITHIYINTIGLKELARHPYVEYYQARDILRLRSLGTRFHSVDDLRAVPSMADSTLKRILPYLIFSDSNSTK